MSLQCLSNALVAFILLATGNAATLNSNISNLDKSSNDTFCSNAVNLYANTNTVKTYTIPAVVQPINTSADPSTAAFTSDSSQVWQVKSIIGNSPGSNDTNNEPLLQTSIYLDTQNDGPLPIPQALSTCNLIFKMPADDGGKTSNDGDCSSLVGKACVDNIQTRIRDLSLSIASSPNMTLEQACNSLSQSLFNLPKSCPKASSEGKMSLFDGQGHNLTSESNNTRCPGGPENLPTPLSESQDPVTYDKLSLKTTPILLAFFSNHTLFTGTPFAETRFLCTKPIDIPGQTPISAAGRPLMAYGTMLSWLVAANALLFFAL